MNKKMLFTVAVEVILPELRNGCVNFVIFQPQHLLSCNDSNDENLNKLNEGLTA